MSVTHSSCAVAIVLLFLFKANAINIEGYYWRDYKGVAPHDALPGGIDLNGNPIYMGQVLYDGKLWPAKIYPYDSKAYFAYYSDPHNSTVDVKILCTQHPEKFIWIPVKHDEIHLLTNYHIIVAGSFPAKAFYFGRVFFRTETSVGRVSTENPPTKSNKGLYITQAGSTFNFQDFEILVYNYNNVTHTAPAPV